MKNSGVEWIGEIPDEWEITQVKNIFNIGRGRVIAQTELDEHGKYPVYSSQTKDNGCLGYINTYDFDINQLTWTTDGANAGTVFLRKGKHNCTNVCGTLQLKQTSNILLFYKYALEYLTIFNKRADTNGFKIMNNEMAKIITLLPPKETQQRIATYLDKKCSKIEETIQNQQQVIEKLKAYKQSLITEAVTGKIKIENGKVCGEYESYKDSGVEWIGKIPSEWEVKKLKYIADTFLKGSGITKEEIVINGDIPCVRYGELYTKYDYHFTECQTRTNLGIIETPKYFSHGDVLFTCTGELVEEIGKSIAYLGNEKCLAGGDIIVLKHSQDPMFMGFALDSKYVQGQKSFGKTKLKVVHISSGEIARLLIVLPPKEEQKEIADYLDKKCTAIDIAIEQKQKLIEKLTEYKKSLIYECVTGKKEI
ncbi:MAG: restriction endonuclease subunit S [Spirochaetaceae bacterium]|nr:restriction endonuclease subunit S [Spirochaetaceae bacterium]